MKQTTLPFSQGEDKRTSPPRRAAIYMRMSTDLQQYSTENQAKAIYDYAEKRNIEVVRKYVDEGKSGLKIDGREALQRLISDVQKGGLDYTMILVLDVTRWGRFQDADESAFLEYTCRRAGLDVQYVAEQFENDGSPVSTIVKSVKRAMAAEQSRELSVKVFAGQCRLIEKGFRQGGHAGYGLRRMRIDEKGAPQGQLKFGERKSLQTDRVILIAGPEDEVENVRWMYSAFTEHDMQESQIAAILNQKGVLTDLGRAWTRATVHEVLTNEKYIGNNVFNRRSFKLKARRVVNKPEMWVQANGVFEAVIETKHFYAAQHIINERNRKFSDEEMLEKLKAVYNKQGWLSGIVIDEAEGMPSSSAYSSRFGSLLRAYELVGYTPDTDYSFIEINRRLRKTHANIIQDTIDKVKELGGQVTQNAETGMLLINGMLKVSLIIARCKQTKAGGYRWKIHLDTGLLPDISIIVRMNAPNEAALDYYLLPALDVENPKLRLMENNSLSLDAYRFNTLEQFFLLTECVDIREIA
jgi:DNA invertase Pin-like site-specific DNA recombinase